MPQVNQYLGQCYLCNAILPHRLIKKHLQKCIGERGLIKLSSKKVGQNEEMFLLKLYSDKDFWMYVIMDSKANLALLDALLRDIWCECCGHLSMFSIGNEQFSEDEDGLPDARDVFYAAKKFSYEYDFGSTTYISGEVVDCIEGSLPRNKRLVLLARNELPEFKCARCGKEATLVCPYCFKVFCEKCLKTKPCCEEIDSDVALPVVNSPRMGVCGYEGEAEDAVKDWIMTE